MADTSAAGLPAETSADLTLYPAPPIPAYVDLRHYKDMPLEVQTLLDSELAGIGDAEIFRCAVLLWCKAWQQVPCGSLEDNDGTLARACGLGRDLRTWMRLKADAMRGFRKASDGRLYHWMVCTKAADAWNKTSAYQWGKRCDVLRKVNKGRKDAGQEPLPMPDKPVEISCGWDKDGVIVDVGTRKNTRPNSSGSAAQPAAPSGGASSGSPPEKPLKGRGREEEEKGSRRESTQEGAGATAPPTSTGSAPPEPSPPKPIVPGGQLALASDDVLDMPAGLDRSPVGQAVALWNETAKRVNAELGHTEWPLVQKITAERRRLTTGRLKDCGGIDGAGLAGFQIALDRASRDRWARGETRRPEEHANWTYNFDYFVKEKTFTKLMEKPHDDDPSRRPGRPADRGLEAAFAGIDEASTGG